MLSLKVGTLMNYLQTVTNCDITRSQLEILPDLVYIVECRPSFQRNMESSKKIIYVGGLADEVDTKVLNAAFIPFGDIVEVNMPIDYETEKHRGFAFIEFELAEDASAAIDNMNDGEMFGRQLRVNLAKPMRNKEGGNRFNSFFKL